MLKFGCGILLMFQYRANMPMNSVQRALNFARWALHHARDFSLAHLLVLLRETVFEVHYFEIFRRELLLKIHHKLLPLHLHFLVPAILTSHRRLPGIIVRKLMLALLCVVRNAYQTAVILHQFDHLAPNPVATVREECRLAFIVEVVLHYRATHAYYADADQVFVFYAVVPNLVSELLGHVVDGPEVEFHYLVRV